MLFRIILYVERGNFRILTLVVQGNYTMNTVQIVDCFYIEVRGEIAHKFMKFCIDEKIFPIKGIGISGPDIHTACYLVKDRERVFSFFKIVKTLESAELDAVYIVEEKDK